MSETRFEATEPESIQGMFGSISGRYDLANSVLSFGIHHVWRRAVVDLSGARPGQQVLDCASGTGDLAFEFERAVGPTGKVTATDFCEPMLAGAITKANQRNSGIHFEVADVMRLPYESASFDIASISFGIRNVADPIQGLREMARVTRPGGVVMVLEFGQSRLPVWGQLFDFYSKNVLPILGGWVTGKPEAYRYLQSSSAHFPCRENFLNLASQTGEFGEMSFRPLMGGIAYAYRLERKLRS